MSGRRRSSSSTSSSSSSSFEERVLQQGWLEKKSPKINTHANSLVRALPSAWQRRYFVLALVAPHRCELRSLILYLSDFLI
jgi:hypothetical protein